VWVGCALLELRTEFDAMLPALGRLISAAIGRRVTMAEGGGVATVSDGPCALRIHPVPSYHNVARIQQFVIHYVTMIRLYSLCLRYRSKLPMSKTLSPYLKYVDSIHYHVTLTLFRNRIVTFASLHSRTASRNPQRWPNC
jgi:hypothetical protein